MLFLNGPRARARNLALSPDGRLLASAGELDAAISLWDGCTGQPRGSLEGHRAPVTGLAFDPATGILASAHRWGHVQLWDPVTCQPLSSPAVRGGFCLAFSPDGRWLAVGQGGQRGYLAQLAAVGRDQAGPVLPGRDQVVYCLAFSPDGRALACGTEEAAWLWEPAAGRAVARLQRPAVVRAVAFAPGGDELALAEGRGVTVWRTATGETRPALEGQEGLVTGVAFTPEGRVLVSGAWGGSVRVWDVRGGRCRATYAWGIGRVYAVAVSPDGMRAAAAGHEGIVLWDLDDGAG
jgi:WD40 repeat protein